jgi:ABC-2 type transport system ATP-binding protein
VPAVIEAQHPHKSYGDTVAVDDVSIISVLGLNPRRDRAELTQRLGVQLQNGQLPDRLQIAEALRLYSSFYRSPADWRALMEMLGIADKSKTRFGQTGLDPQARRDTWELIESVRAREERKAAKRGWEIDSGWSSR